MPCLIHGGKMGRSNENGQGRFQTQVSKKQCTLVSWNCSFTEDTARWPENKCSFAFYFLCVCFKRFILCFLWTGVSPALISGHHMHAWYPQRPEKGIRRPGTQLAICYPVWGTGTEQQMLQLAFLRLTIFLILFGSPKGVLYPKLVEAII